MARKLQPIHQDHEPIPAEIEARLTKLKPPETMYQAAVEVRGKDEPLFIGPKFNARAPVELIVEAINKQIVLGNEKRWSNAQVAVYL